MKIVESFVIKRRGTVWCVDAAAPGLKAGATVRSLRDGTTWLVRGVERRRPLTDSGEDYNVGKPVGMMLDETNAHPEVGEELEVV